MQKVLQFFGISTTDFDLADHQRKALQEQAALERERMRRGMYP